MSLVCAMSYSLGRHIVRSDPAKHMQALERSKYFHCGVEQVFTMEILCLYQRLIIVIGFTKKLIFFTNYAWRAQVVQLHVQLEIAESTTVASYIIFSLS